MKYLPLILLMFILCFNSDTTAQILTIGEVFDFEIGDEFQYENHYGEVGPGGFKHVILEKLYTLNQDTITYVIENWSYQPEVVWTHNTNDQYLEYKIRKSWHQKRYFDLDSSIYLFDGRGATRIDEPQDSGTYQYDSVVYFSNELCQTLVNGYHIESGVFEPSHTTKHYGKGIGIVTTSQYVFNIPSPASNGYKLIYYKKGNVECGTQDKHLSHIKEVPADFVKVYPTLVQNILFIEPLYAKCDDCQVTCYNSNGAEITSRPLTDPMELNVSYFPKGVYFLHIQDGHKKVFKRFMVQ